MRLINVSNRLPVTISNNGNSYVINRSIGGVAIGMNAFLKHYKKLSGNEVIWVGWPGLSLNDDAMLDETLKKQSCYPVKIPDLAAEDFYHGFSNQTLWPLFHHLTSHTIYNEKQWHIYQQVNELFCDSLAKIIRPGDCVWIHDYHLLLLPKLIKDRFPNNSVGFFLHISFPSLDIFQFLPKACRDSLLNGMLGSNLIGFHTHEYSQNFIRVVRRTLGLEQYMGYVRIKEKMTRMGVYPMGIDIEEIKTLSKSNSVKSAKNEFLTINRNLKIILSADRLDYTKGIINKLLAYQLFLEINPEWHNNVVLMLIVAPSREQIHNYSVIKKEIDELVGSINGKFGDANWLPIRYQYKSFTMEKMVSYYSAADVAFIMPVRDGMNLIAKEFVAAKLDQNGVLILSETAGAAKELLGALIVNPHCQLEMVFALKQALEMPEYEQQKRMVSMQNTLEKYNLTNWGHKFLNDLMNIKAANNSLQDKVINNTTQNDIKNSYQQAKSRLIALDYDGTLVPFNKDITKALPSGKVINLIRSLAQDAKNSVVIISGRNKESLENWLGHLNVDLIAEHGGWLKESAWQKTGQFATGWKEHIRSILQIFTDRLDGSFIEEKEFSIVWHYRSANESRAEDLARELSEYLIVYTDKTDLRVLMGKKTVEVKCAQVGKNFAIENILKRNSYDFILAAGDDVTDEDMFLALPKDAISIKIGLENSYARFHAQKQGDFINFLDLLVTVS